MDATHGPKFIYTYINNPKSYVFLIFCSGVFLTLATRYSSPTTAAAAAAAPFHHQR
jgi:hypothetical protein